MAYRLKIQQEEITSDEDFEETKENTKIETFTKQLSTSRAHRDPRLRRYLHKEPGAQVVDTFSG